MIRRDQRSVSGAVLTDIITIVKTIKLSKKS